MGGRAAFVIALRWKWHDLWRAMNAEVWRARPRPDLATWARHQGLGIVDRWLVDALQQTLEYWDRKPDSPDAPLERGAKWFYYARGEGTIPDFQPMLDTPYPTYTAPADVLERFQAVRTWEDVAQVRESVKIETMEAFKRRMLGQVRQQLGEYISSVRKAVVYDSKPRLPTHAAWTALALSGRSIAEISREPEWKRFLRSGEPESTVGKGVARFSQYIGLTLSAQKQGVAGCLDL
jgi:hypothetical protein